MSELRALTQEEIREAGDLCHKMQEALCPIVNGSTLMIAGVATAMTALSVTVQLGPFDRKRSQAFVRSEQFLQMAASLTDHICRQIEENMDSFMASRTDLN